MNIEVAPKETEIQANWYDAVIYCQFLDVDNKTDWRMPTKEELDYIYKSKNNFVGSYYWSSTESTGDCAWYQYFANRERRILRKNYSCCVRAVRDIK